jgi:subfamily B ATP-binding cassette protein MsbA
MDKLVLQWLGHAIRRYPLRSILLVILSLLSSVADGLSVSLIIPLLVTLFKGVSLSTGDDDGALIQLLNRISHVAGPGNELIAIASIIVGLVALRSVLVYWDVQIASWISGNISHEIRAKIHANLLGVDYQYVALEDNGRLLNTLDGETWRTTDAITTIFGLFTNVCMIGAFTTVLLLISWKLTVIVIALVGAVSLLRRLLDTRTRKLSEQSVEAAADLSERAVELFDGMRMVRAFGRETQTQTEYEGSSRRLFGISLRMTKLTTLASSVQETLYAIIFAIVIFIAIALHVGGASMIAFLALLHRMQPHVKALDEGRTHLIALSGSVRAVSELLDLKPWIQHDDGKRTLPLLKSNVRFDNVSFTYSGKSAERRNAIADVSCEIPIGKTTALVGWSGAGKSTLINLLLRFYDPDSGTISIDGVPLKEMDLDWWRRQLAIAGQDADLITGTIRDNIAFARPSATMDEIVEAARQANIHDFIAELPKGYDTDVGSRGLLLSGGQRQRIGLARAILRPNGILILDEATNALDSMSEHEVFKSLEAIHGTRTVIIIAHRLSTTRKADQVIVLAHGKVAEIGAPAELYRRGGLFSKMVQLQELDHIVGENGVARDDSRVVSLPTDGASARTSSV